MTVEVREPKQKLEPNAKLAATYGVTIELTPDGKAQLKKSVIEDLLDKGVQKPVIADIFGLSKSQFQKALVAMGLSKKQAKSIGFVIIPEDDVKSDAQLMEEIGKA